MLKKIGGFCTYKLLLNNPAVFTNSLACFSSKTEAPNLGLKNPKKRIGDENIKVTLVLQNDDISIVSLAEAQKISKKRELKLVKIVDLDTKTSRPVYRLMSGSEYLQEDQKRRAEKREARKQPHIKGEKLLPISAQIANHDLETRVRMASKWLKKSYEIRVIISGDGKPASISEGIFGKLEKDLLQYGKINQKHIKGGDIKFYIRPNLENLENESHKENIKSDKSLDLKSDGNEQLEDPANNEKETQDTGSQEKSSKKI